MKKYQVYLKKGFAVNHPGGLLGKSLLMKVKNLMWKAEKCPVLAPSNSLKDAVLLMTENNLGGCAILENNQFKGIIVEGDIRRAFANEDFGLQTKLEKMMNRSPISIGPDALAVEALKLMEARDRQISIMPVIDRGFSWSYSNS